MTSKRAKRKRSDRPKSQQIWRYWVELQDLRNGSIRNLSLKGVVRIHLPTKKGSPQLPDAHVIQVEDTLVAWEATDIDDLARQLREKYPDGSFKRTLKSERDQQAEERYWGAIRGLAHLLADAVVRDFERERKDMQSADD